MPLQEVSGGGPGDHEAGAEVTPGHSAQRSCFFFSHEGQKLCPRQEKATRTLAWRCLNCYHTAINPGPTRRNKGATSRPSPRAIPRPLLCLVRPVGGQPHRRRELRICRSHVRIVQGAPTYRRACLWWYHRGTTAASVPPPETRTNTVCAPVRRDAALSTHRRSSLSVSSSNWEIFGGHAGSLLVEPGIPSTRHEASASIRPAVSPPSETPPVHSTAGQGTMAAPDVRSVASPVLSRASPRCRRCPIRTRRPRYRRSRLDR